MMMGVQELRRHISHLELFLFVTNKIPTFATCNLSEALVKEKVMNKTIVL